VLAEVLQDGNYVEPFETDHVLINAGERYGVLLTTKADAAESWIMLETRYRKVVAGYAILSTSTEGLRSPAREPPVHPGRWTPQAMELESQYRSLEANKADAVIVGPLKDQVR